MFARNIFRTRKCLSTSFKAVNPVIRQFSTKSSVVAKPIMKYSPIVLGLIGGVALGAYYIHAEDLTKEKLAQSLDHTFLLTDAGTDELYSYIDDAIKYNLHSICVPLIYVKSASEYIKKKHAHTKVAAVVGFPCGYTYTEIKVAETKEALKDGASEIEMVLPIGYLKDGKKEYIKNEIRLVSEECKASGATLKVVLETCELTNEEIKLGCELAGESGANYVMTSTGFLHHGATQGVVKIMKNTCDKYGMKVKASGGIRNCVEAENMIDAGADLIGTSSSTRILAEFGKEE